jgi:hypothetical protein
MNVINGFSSFRSLFSNRRRGFCNLVVWAVGKRAVPLEVVMMALLGLGGFVREELECSRREALLTTNACL